MPLPITLYDTTRQSPSEALVHMAFGASWPGAITHTGLAPLSPTQAIESWGSRAPRESGQQGPIEWLTDGDCLFCHATTPLGDDAASVTQHLYEAILAFVANSAFPHLLRIWHYLPRINAGAGERELYQRFCVGRARAFDAYPYTPGQLPAGTAIGTRQGDELLIYFIATKQPGRQIENPRQVSAFDYPRQYAPRKPLFSRAVVWSDDHGEQLLVSGTASIVGHASRHANNLEAQLTEVWLNLESLRQAAGATHPVALRVYIRNEADYPAIRDFLRERLAPNVATLYLLADICRSELLVEIEGVYAMP